MTNPLCLMDSQVFFKQTWPCVGHEVIEAILEFFQTGKMLRQINAATSCLNPKYE